MIAPRCPICGARGAVAVAAPGAFSMLSDGAPRGVPVARLFCRRCGSTALHPAVLRRLPRRLYGGAYALNAGPPSAADLNRQAGYAARIARLSPVRVPRSVLDIGCGNGALLALRRLWP
ncbi:MAG: class I SAM-dependent methyltransferase, partial [Acetobacteraceae bacterium]|nr:class I SAM-dependent methyltransferase [Acetobacteraceae bacterium]